MQLAGLVGRRVVGRWVGREAAGRLGILRLRLAVSPSQPPLGNGAMSPLPVAPLVFLLGLATSCVLVRAEGLESPRDRDRQTEREEE